MLRSRFLSSALRHAACACALLAPAASAVAAPGTAWTTNSPGGTVDAGFYTSCGPKPVLLDAAGNSILVRVLNGSGSVFLSIAKFGPDGQLLWRFDDLSEPRTHTFRALGPCLAALDALGNIVVASTGDLYYQPTGLRRMVTVKYSGLDGTRVWKAESDTIGPGAMRGLAVDAQGNVFVMARGNQAPPLSGGRTVIAKYDGATGGPAWPSRPDSELVTTTTYSMLALDAQGTDVVVASTSVAAKLLGSTGDTVWSKAVPSINGDNDFLPHGLAVDGMGDVVVVKSEFTGEFPIGPGRSRLLRDFVAVKLSGTTGDPLWTGLPQNLARYDGPTMGDDAAKGVALDAVGNVFVHGISQSSGYDAQHYDFATLKLEVATGTPTWTALPSGAARYNGAGNHRDYATDVATNAAGDVFVTGSATNASGDEDFLTRKYSGATGQPLWSALPEFAAVHDGANGGFDLAEGLAIGSAGDVFVVGREDGTINDDQVVFRLDGGTGAALWSSRSEPMVTRRESLTDLQTKTAVVDAEGNTFVAGSSFNGNCDEWLVMKVGSDGTRLWVRRFAASRTASIHRCGRALALALDVSGDVFVTGDLKGGIATAKFSGIDGTPLWGGLPDGVAVHENPYAYYAGYLLAIDHQGDVVVTGGSAPNNSPGTSLYTFKYDGESGAQLWAGQHGSTPYYQRSGGNMHPTGLAIDTDGHVIVAAIANLDAVTIKYDGSTGTPVWSGLPEGVAAFRCYWPLLALDPAQNPIVACSADTDFATIKYSSTTGIPVWTQRSDGSVRYSGPGADGPSAISTDSNGDIYVSGSSADAGTADWVTVKYSGGDGTPLWPSVAARYDHPAAAFLLRDDQTLVLAGRQSAPSTPLVWSVFDTQTGARKHALTLSATPPTVRATTFGPGGDLWLAGTADETSTPTVFVSRITGFDVSVFGSGFEGDQ